MAESGESDNLNLFVKRFGKYLKRKGIKGNPKRYTSKTMNQTLLTLHVIIVKTRTYQNWMSKC